MVAIAPLRAAAWPQYRRSRGRRNPQEHAAACALRRTAAGFPARLNGVFTVFLKESALASGVHPAFSLR
jgi:hypothetical protein